MTTVLEQKETLIGKINYGDRGPKGQDGISITSVDVNNDGSLTFNYNDGTSFTTDPLVITETSDWNDVLNKPFSSIGDNLLVENGVLKVNTTTDMTQDNTQPITSGGVYVVVGNIDTLLQTI